MHYYQPIFTSCGKPMRVAEVELADGVVYPVFAEMIMHYSSFFRDCLSNNSPESRGLKVELTDPVWAPVFGFVVDWMINGRSLKSSEANPPVVTYISDDLIYEDHCRPTVQECVDIWLLADHLGMPGLQNYMIYHLAEQSNIGRLDLVSNCLERNPIPEDSTCQVPAHVLTRVWDKTLPESMLREFFMAVVCHTGMKKDPDIFGILRPDISSDFLKHYDQINSAVSEILVDQRYETFLSGATVRKIIDIAGFFAPLSAAQYYVPE